MNIYKNISISNIDQGSKIISPSQQARISSTYIMKQRKVMENPKHGLHFDEVD